MVFILMKINFKKSLLYGLGLLFCAGFSLFVSIKTYYSRFMPQVPDIASGHVLAMQANHGITVYITIFQRNLLFGVVAADAALLVLFVALFIMKPNWLK
jgi:hypothetical protein